jgi:uncharacterized protein
VAGLSSPSADHPNALLLRRAHAAFASGDTEAIGQLFAPDIVSVIPGRSSVSGTERGIGNVLANAAAIMERTNGTYRADAIDYLGTDRHAVALTRLTAERDGVKLDIGQVVIFEVVDGKLANSFHIPYDLYAWDDFIG